MMKHTLPLRLASFSLMVIIGTCAACSGGGGGGDSPTSSAAVYSIPNDDTDCPANCRVVPWSAGSDQWNGGVLPARDGIHEVPCIAGLTEGDGLTDNFLAIQTCINSASPGQAVKIPPGIYYVNDIIRLKSNVTLRGSGGGPGSQGTWLSSSYSGDTGAGAKNTTFKLGPGGLVVGGSSSSGNFDPPVAILSGYTKGSTTLTMAPGHGFTAGDRISLYEDNDPAIVTIIGDNGNCTFCGNNNGNQTIQQFALVTAVNGDVIQINRSLYYTYKAILNPSAQRVKITVEKAGIEQIKLNGWSDQRIYPIVHFEQCLYCWAAGIETYNAPICGDCSHVKILWSHGVEVRDSFLHFGRVSTSGVNYGIALFFWNSDHKFENNILRHHRHSILFQGGGSGSAVLYNYIDDNYTNDTSYLGSARMNHGAHPMMNLYEGNWVSHLTADSFFGSSSHITLFRNWLRGAESGIDVPNNPPEPTWGFIAADIWKNQKYYSVVGNVLGVPNWANGTVRDLGNCSLNTSTNTTPVAYNYGCDSNGNYDAATATSIISHGNYDYVSDSVAFWDGGSAHALKSSMYYGAKPAFFGAHAWPPFGPDITPMTKALPAKDRFCSAAGSGC